MDSSLLNKYLNGWRAVEKFETLELRRTPLKFKFKQILSIFQFGVGLGVMKTREKDDYIKSVRSRWCLLKAGY